MNDKEDIKAEEMEQILKDLENESAKGDKMSYKDRYGKHKEDSEKNSETKNNVQNDEKKDGTAREDDIKDKDAGNEAGGDKKDNKEEKKEEKKEKKETPGEDKKEKKDAKQEKIDELNDRVMRQMAEFENFRKRTEKEKDSMFDAGARSVIEKILPVVDNFERGIQTVPDAEKDGAFAQGVRMIYKQLTDELDKMGVKPIEALGKPFDPNFHNAVMQVDSDEYETGIVSQELQKGYTYHDVVIRHSMVAVVK